MINELNRGGAERLVLDIARRLAQNENVDPIVVVGQDRGELRDEFLSSDAKLISLNNNITELGIPTAITRLIKVLQNEEPDVVHSHLPFSHIVSRLASKICRIPHISTYHNVADHKGHHKRLAENVTSHMTNKIICVSHGVKDTYPNKSKFDVIPNAIDVELFSKAVKSSQTPDLSIDLEDKEIILNVARCVKQKRQVDIIEVMRELDPADYHLIIVGNGPLRNDLQAQVDDYGVNNSVTITGYVEKIEPFYSIADVFVSASTNEGLPTTHLEAMAAELPIVSTDIPGVDEIVDHGDNGFLVPVKSPRSMREHILKIEAIDTQFGRAGFNIVKINYSLEAITQSHVRLYKEQM